MVKNIYKAKKGTLNARVETLGGEIGFRFDKWQIELDKLFTALGNDPVEFLEVFEDIVTKLFTAIKDATPIKTGQAIASWRINKVTDTDSEIAWRIVNGVPYIVFLELGSSKKAASGMVRINLDKFIRDTRTLIKGLKSA